MSIWSWLVKQTEVIVMTNLNQFTDYRIGAIIHRAFKDGSHIVHMPQRRTRAECKRSTRVFLNQNSMVKFINELRGVDYK